MTIIDFVGAEVVVGDYFVYPTAVGHSVYNSVYQLKEICVNNKVKARKINTNAKSQEYQYKKFIYDETTSKGQLVDMTEKQRAAVDNKLSSLSYFKQRACKIEYKEKL